MSERVFRDRSRVHIMSMYTTFNVSLKLRPDTPMDVMDIVKHMLHVDGLCSDPCPNKNRCPDAFSGCSRWEHMLSWYPAKDRTFSSTLAGYQVGVVGSSIKNYDNEVEKFARWIAPFCLAQNEPIIEITDVEGKDGYCWQAFADGTFRDRQLDDHHDDQSGWSARWPIMI